MGRNKINSENKIIENKGSNIAGYAGKISSFLSKKVLILVSNFLLLLVSLFSASMVYLKYKIRKIIKIY